MNKIELTDLELEQVKLIIEEFDFHNDYNINQVKLMNALKIKFGMIDMPMYYKSNTEELL